MDGKNDYEQDLAYLQSFRSSLNLDSLEMAAEDIVRKWSSVKGEYYFALILKICNMLSSFDFQNYARQDSLIHKYAGLALVDPDIVPLEVELQLLIHLQEDLERSKGVVQGEEWSEQRRTRAKLWLHAWQRLWQEIDHHFDFNDLPELNITPPPGASSRSGVAPEHIEDPKLRAEYEAAIEKNKKKAEDYNKQQKLREMDKSFSSKAEQYIIRMYSIPPFDIEELIQYLDSHVLDTEKRDRILNVVKQNMSNELR